MTARGDRRRVALGGVLIATVLLAGCGGRAGEPGGEETGERAGGRRAAAPAWTDSAPTLAIDSLLRRLEAHVGGSRATARERRGRPQEEHRRTLPNRHVPDAVDTLVRLEWSGTEARYHVSGANQREFLSSVELTGREALDRLLPPSLGSMEGVRRVLGDPERVEGRRWTYVCCRERPGARESLVVRFERERVVGVRAGYFVD